MIEWKAVALKNITTKIGSGSTPTGGGESYKDVGVSLVRSQNILDFKFSEQGLAFIDENQAYELRSVTMDEEDVLLNITGDSVARCCIIPKKILPARVNQHVAIIRANKEIAKPHYLLYNLIYQKETLLTFSEVGATRRALTKSMIEDFELFLPPLPEQERIAEVLSSLDDKIGLLHRNNKTLEQLAETLFRQWFVEEAKESWEETKIGQFIIPKKGKNITKSEAINGIYPVVAGGLKPSCYHNQSNTKSPVITISASGANAGFLKLYYTEVWSSDSSFIDETVTNFIYFFYVQLKLKQTQIFDKQEGSAQPHIYPSHIMDLETFDYPVNLVDKYNQTVKPFFDKIGRNLTQIQQLETLRDTLLPKLMSGVVRVEN